VLIDTLDKASGRRLLAKDRSDKSGFLTLNQIEQIESHARARGIKALWAGGYHMRDAYVLDRLGVFGIYVTSGAATTVPVGGSYLRDPALAGVTGRHQRQHNATDPGKSGSAVPRPGRSTPIVAACPGTSASSCKLTSHFLRPRSHRAQACARANKQTLATSEE
jgi:hypothetical protein